MYFPRVTKTLDNIINALQEFNDIDNANIVAEKKGDILDFRDSLVLSFDQAVQEGMTTADNNNLLKGYLLSGLGLDRMYYYPKDFKSYLPPLFLIGILYILTAGKSFSLEYLVIALVNNVFLYGLIWNPISKGGVWKMRKAVKFSKETFQRLDVMLNQLKVA